MKRATIAIVLACVVVFIMLGVATPRLGHSKHPQLEATRHEFSVIRSKLEEYRKVHGEFPSEEIGLSFLAPDLFVKGVREQYRPKRVTDPWGTPFRYQFINGKPKLRSAGPDARFDTPDDITD
jgi:type II secretory pathway pseudopilin PulG